MEKKDKSSGVTSWATKCDYIEISIWRSPWVCLSPDVNVWKNNNLTFLLQGPFNLQHFTESLSETYNDFYKLKLNYKCKNVNMMMRQTLLYNSDRNDVSFEKKEGRSASAPRPSLFSLFCCFYFILLSLKLFFTNSASFPQTSSFQYFLPILFLLLSHFLPQILFFFLLKFFCSTLTSLSVFLFFLFLFYFPSYHSTSFVFLSIFLMFFFTCSFPFLLVSLVWLFPFCSSALVWFFLTIFLRSSVLFLYSLKKFEVL